MPHKHEFQPSTIEHYEICLECGTMHRIGGIDDSVYANQYWSQPHRSTLLEQVYNVSELKFDGRSKIDCVLYYDNGGVCALEIACAPGILLKRLSETYHITAGIEFDSQYADQYRAIAGENPTLLFGKFPSITKACPAMQFDFICGMDILEHVEDGCAFILEVQRLLKPTGTVVLMLPVKFDDGKFDDKNYHPEHLWIYSQSFLKEWLGEMFKTIIFDRWTVGHEIIVLRNPY